MVACLLGYVFCLRFNVLSLFKYLPHFMNQPVYKKSLSKINEEMGVKKGQNVTNTAFKIRPIVLQEQLKERDTEGVLSKKKANIDELISKLKHYNEAVKVEACTDLKDVVNSHPLDAIQIYLAPILQNASVLIQDRERKVRRNSIKLLHAILEKISSSTVRPFFNYILTNLKCAMTNINKHIQEDSLLLLDALLENQSLLIAENLDAVFPTFLTLISKSKSNLGTERSLSLNLEGKVSSVKWRVKVLTRLYGILNALAENGNGTNVNDVRRSVDINVKGVCFIPLYKDVKQYEKDFFHCSLDKTTKEFDTQIANLTQLLHEVWVEVVPEKSSNQSKKNASEPTVLPTEESVAVFSCIVKILHLLHDYLQRCDNVHTFSNNKSTIFIDHLVSDFPYIHNRKHNFEITKDFSKSFVMNYDQNCVEENLMVIYVFLTLRINLNVRNKPKTNTVASYLNNCLKSPRNLSTASCIHLVKILKELFLKPANMCQRLGMNEAEIMENTVSFYSNSKISDCIKSALLEVLTSPRFEKYPLWMEKLPQFLCTKQVSVRLIEAILNLCRKGQKSVQDGVQSYLKPIIENLPSVEIHQAADVELARRKFVSIFFYLPNLTPEDLHQISDFIKFKPGCSYSKYLQNVIELRSMFSR